jgi:FixJ family two-component response regulator
VEVEDFEGDGCILLDLAMPGMSGSELHSWLRERGVTLPVIFLSGHADVSTSVAAMKHGAFDVLEKPADADVLLQAVDEAVERHHQERLRRAAADEVSCRVDTLSARERQVLGHVVAGRLNKQIAADLEISEKTVKVHRGRAMAKMKVRSIAQLVRLCDQVGLK